MVVREPTLDDAPFYLPRAEIGARSVELTTADRSGTQPTPAAFVQEFALADGSGLATIETTIGAPSPAMAGATPVEFAGWTSASLIEGASGATVTLSDARGFARITVRSSSDPGRTATTIAGALTRQSPNEPGWTVSPESLTTDPQLVAGIVPLASGWASGWQQRLAKWIGSDAGPLVEIIVSVGQPYLVGWTSLPGVPQLLDDLGDVPAVGLVIEGRGSLVAWSLGGGATATVMTRGSIPETADLVRSLVEVDEPTRETVGRLLPPRVEFGCDYFLDSC